MMLDKHPVNVKPFLTSVIGLCVLLNASFAGAIDWSNTYIWVEPGASFRSGGSVELKLAKGNRFIAVGVTGLSEEEGSGFIFGQDVVDRDTQEVVDVGSNNEFSVLYGARGSNRWGYVDIGLGLGLITGNFASGCNTESAQGFFSSSRTVCSEVDQDVSAISIPLEFNAVFGNTLGFGIFYRVSFSRRGNQSSVGFTLPLGKFN